MNETESIPEAELGTKEFRKERLEQMMFANQPEAEAHLEWIQAHPYQYLAWIEKNFKGGVKEFEATIQANTQAVLKEIKSREEKSEAA